MKRWIVYSYASLIAYILGAIGCSDHQSGLPGGEGKTAHAVEPIFNGISVVTDDHGTVEVQNISGFCSGTVLASNWVLTAHHCVSLAASFTGMPEMPTGRITVNTVDHVQAKVVQIIRHPT